MSTTVRVSDKTKARLAALSSATGRPMTDVIEDAIDALERRIFFQDLNRRFGELREDEAQWSEIQAERRAWDPSLPDTSR